MKNPLNRREFGTFSVILLAFIPGAHGVLKVVRRFARAIINNGKSYALIGAQLLLGRSFLRELGSCRLLRIYSRWKAFLFFWKGSPRFRKSATDKSSSEFSCLRGENAPTLLCFSPVRAEFFRSQVDIRSFELLENAYLAAQVCEAIIQDVLAICSLI